jgi:hypothetical protein
MTTNFLIHRTIVFSVNIAIIVLIILRVYQINNDKGILLIIFLYPLIVLINLIIWLSLRIFKNEHSVIYKQSLLGLLILFIPTIIIGTSI